MLLPPQYLWLEPVVMVGLAVFLAGLIANALTFSNRIISAFVTAVLFILIVGATVYFGYSSVQITVQSVPLVTAPIHKK